MTINVQPSIFNELAEFLVSQPTLEEIAAYKVPLEVQQHIDQLLDKHRGVGLSLEEHLELEKIMVMADVMDLAKAKARLKLAGKA